MLDLLSSLQSTSIWQNLFTIKHEICWVLTSLSTVLDRSYNNFIQLIDLLTLFSSNQSTVLDRSFYNFDHIFHKKLLFYKIAFLSTCCYKFMEAEFPFPNIFKMKIYISGQNLLENLQFWTYLSMVLYISFYIFGQN